jgi:hypothetical protein
MIGLSLFTLMQPFIATNWARLPTAMTRRDPPELKDQRARASAVLRLDTYGHYPKHGPRHADRE